MTVRYLDLDQLLELAELILGRPAEVRDAGLLSSAAARPSTTLFGVEAYEDLWAKAAALLQSIAMNHALVDGNKRLAWVAARTFLDINGVSAVDIDTDKAETFIIAVVTHQLDGPADIAQALSSLYAAG